MKIYIYFLLSRIYNSSFKKRINEFVYLFILSAVMIKIVSLFSSDIIGLSIFLIIMCGALSITTIRGSNVVIYSMLTKHLSMNILDSSNYYVLDYYRDREKIADTFREEFIQGLEDFATKPFCSKIKMTTHKWVFDEILCDERVISLYEIEANRHKTCRIPQEVLLLNSLQCISNNKGKLITTAFQEREQYKVILKKKK